MTLSILTSGLFAIGALTAFAIIAATLRTYWPMVAAVLRDGVPDAEVQDVLVTTVSVNVRSAARVLRPNFRARMPLKGRVLRAAA